MFDIEAIVEIPFGSHYKYELDKKSGQLVLDRQLFEPLPYTYGFVPNTLHADGDPLDICIIGKKPIYPLTRVKVVILGAFICDDNGDSDDKLVARLSDEVYDECIKTEYINEINLYLSRYKKGFIVKEFVGLAEASKIIMRDTDAFQDS